MGKCRAKLPFGQEKRRGDFMVYKIESVTEVPDRSALHAMLLEFYGVMLRKFAAAGGPPNYTPQDLIASFWPDLHKFMPPTGRLILAHDENERLVGCGTLQQARPDAGELKRLYVRPEAAGHRLGQAIVDARIEAARQMGWRTLLVNTPIGNRDMLRLYERIGFRYIDRFPECSDPSEVAEFFIYMQLDLD
jgi:GNAT superfamily N-acetyltransferase